MFSVINNYSNSCHPERSASKHSFAHTFSSAESKDPDNACATMPRIGILSKLKAL